MAMTPKLEMRQGQSLVMTPQLQQAIKLLQMSNVDLQAFVDAELERNPLIERDEDAAAPRQEAGAGETVADAHTGHDGDRTLAQAGETESAAFSDAAAAGRDARIRRFRAGPPTVRATGGSFNPAGGFDPHATPGSREPLCTSISPSSSISAITDPADRLIGAYLIGMVDDRRVSHRRRRCGGRAAGSRQNPTSSAFWRCCRTSIRRASWREI